MLEVSSRIANASSEIFSNPITYSGEVKAIVQGSESRPYEVTVAIQALNKDSWTELKTACAGQIDSLQELMAGKFPKKLGELFMARGKGLFPEPKEISLSCSCPDYASMCKHVAAVLYGIGARLDARPELFFELRNVNTADLVSEAIAGKSEEMLKKSGRKSRRVLDNSDLSETFGIDVDV